MAENPYTTQIQDLQTQISQMEAQMANTGALTPEWLKLRDQIQQAQNQLGSLTEQNQTWERENAPPPPETPEAKLLRLQLEQMQEEQEWNALMRPQLLRNMGLAEDTDPDTGKKTLRAMTEEEKILGMTDEEKSAYEVERLQAQRQAKAARGELETPQTILDELARQREQQQTLASQRLGAKGAMLSTPGIRGRMNQLGTEAGVKSAYSYGQEGQGLGLLQQSGDYLGNLAYRNQNVYGGFPNAGMGLLGQAQTASQPYTLGRQLQEEYDLMGKQRRTALYGGIMSGLGTAASMYFSKGMGGGGGR